MTALAANRHRLAWLILTAAMVASATFLLIVGRDLSFAGDELYYFAHLTQQGYAPSHVGGLEYLLSPHNDHFVFLGRVVYEALFAIAGTDYVVFRIAGIAGIFVCVGLLFTLAARRIDPLVALAPCILLLFLGFAYETLLWPFNLHTVYSLAFGLGAVLALERGDRRGDVIACALLVCSVATVELGLAFVAGVAVSVLLRGDRWRRVWIFLVPIAVYAIWWLWARKFDQPTSTLLNVHLIPTDVGNALSAVTGSLAGVNTTGVGVPAQTTGITSLGAVLAGAVAAALAFRVWRGRLPAPFWLVLVTLLAYWVTIALGGRPPDSSRYVFVGSVLLILLASYALDGVRVPLVAGACVAIVAVLAIGPNLAKLFDGRRLLLNDAAATRTEFAMLELSRDHVEPGYTPGADSRVIEASGGNLVAISAEDYFRGAAEHGSLAYSLGQVRTESPPFRAVADATLISALRVKLDPTAEPHDGSSCPSLVKPSPQHRDWFQLPGEGVVLSPRSDRPLTVALRRFETAGLGTPIGTLQPGEWAALKAPPDSAPDSWMVVVDRPVTVCEPG